MIQLKKILSKCQIDWLDNAAADSLAKDKVLTSFSTCFAFDVKNELRLSGGDADE